MVRTLAFAGAAVAAVFSVSPAWAKRDLPVPTTAGWQHAGSKLILMSKLGGLARTELYDLGAKELDVVGQYADTDRATQATIYLFKPALMSVPVWFDRSLTQIRLRSNFGTIASRQTMPLAFAATRSPVTDGLRQSFAVEGGKMRSTSLAVMPVDSWLVVVRLSSTVLDEGQIDSKLTEIISGIRFPSGLAAGEVAEPVKPCTTSQKRFRARLMKPDMGQVLLGAMTPQLEAKAAADAKRDGKPTEPSKPLCRDGEGSENFGLYRTDDGAKSYMMAFGDAGRIATVSAGIALLNPNPGFQVIFRDLDSSSVYPMFDRLPQPEQVMTLIANGSPLSQTSGDGNTVTVSPSAAK